MIQVFKTDEQYVKWLNGQTLPSGIVVYVSDDETMYFSTNNIKGELKTYKCEKEEPIIYPPLVYSAKSAGSTIKVNGQSVTLEQGENITLEYPTAITSVKATDNTVLTAITIPNTVTSIEHGNYSTAAFGSCISLASVTLPDSLTMIGSFAFSNCYKLSSINIPDSVTLIGMHTFSSCKQLGSITLPDSLTMIGDSAFSDCKLLASINIPDSVTMIGNSAFDGCSSLSSINIPDSVTRIGDYTFSSCAALGSITIPDGVTSIGNNAFYGCVALTDFNYNGTKAQWSSITLDDTWKDNAPFTVVHCTDGDVSLEEPIQPIQPNNLVYSTNAAGSTIEVNGETVTLEQGENIVLDYPNEITSVKPTSNTALTAITIPNTVTKIENWAFYDCSALASITIPSGVTSIGDNAFYYCKKLTDFNYNGTKAQWASITKGTNWKYNTGFSKVHCTDGDVTL